MKCPVLDDYSLGQLRSRQRSVGLWIVNVNASNPENDIYSKELYKTATRFRNPIMYENKFWYTLDDLP